jgi:hypothetical protein
MLERTDLNVQSQRASVEWIVRKFSCEPRVPHSIANVNERADVRAAQQNPGQGAAIRTRLRQRLQA